MSNHTSGLYRVQQRDISRAGGVLLNAFQDDPVWKKILAGARAEQQQGVFEVPLRYCLRYGRVYAPSQDLEGIITWVPGHLADMTLWRIIRSGAIWSGLKVASQLAAKLAPIFTPIEADRKKNMQGKRFLYVPILGIGQAHQGQGLGGKLLNALIAESEQAGVPIYLETETESNVRWYGKFGFETIKQITLPVIDLPMWEMIRKP